MSIIDQLAVSLGRRDEMPNLELAKRIIASNDKNAVQELIALLSNKNKAVQRNCIKVLYEVGKQKPGMIAPYSKTFIILLQHKDNRLQWGAMTALNAIVLEDPKTIAAALPKILAAADNGSVITKDYALNILIALCSIKTYATGVFELLCTQLSASPANQLPMYAERSLPIITAKNKAAFIKILNVRLAGIDKETKRMRIEKIIKKLG